MIKVYNCTACDIMMEDKYRNRKLYRRGNDFVKVELEDELVGEIDGIPVYKEKIKSFSGIPNQEYEGVMFIVSEAVFRVLKDRNDLLTPDLKRVVKDPDGRVVAAKAWKIRNENKLTIKR